MNIPGFISGRKPSKVTAKERLKLILEYDKKNIPPHLVEKIKDEIIKVISAHLDVNREDLELNITKSIEQNGVSLLIDNVPIKNK